MSASLAGNHNQARAQRACVPGVCAALVKSFEPPTIRLLLGSDAAAYQRLRVRGLAEHPLAFTSSVDEEAARPLAWAVQRLSPTAQLPHDFFLGAFSGAELLGQLGLEGRYRPKERHAATLLGMYVASEAAGRGVGQALLEALLDRARALPELEQIELTVTEGNRRAQALYERNGFRAWGVRPQAVKLDGQAYAKIHMVCRLR